MAMYQLVDVLLSLNLTWNGIRGIGKLAGYSFAPQVPKLRLLLLGIVQEEHSSVFAGRELQPPSPLSHLPNKFLYLHL